MSAARRVLLFAIGLLAAHAASAYAQSTLYHLHREFTDDFFTCGWSLKTPNGPDAAVLAIQSADLKNKPISTGPVACFQTFTNPGGTIPASSTVTFALWMKKTANWGVILPTAELRLKSGALFCSATGTAPSGGPIGTAFPSQAFTFSCTTPPSPIVMSATDPLRLYVGYSITTVPGNHSVKVELDLETGFDSQVTAPTPVPPAITTINPSSGPGDWPVTVTGTNFGTTGSLKFGTTGATVTTWTNTSIAGRVPVGLNAGPGPLSVPVTVTTGGVASNAYSFSVIAPPSVASVTPALAHNGDTVTIAGANFLATQGTSTVKFNGFTASPTSWNDTTIVTPVPASATTGSVVVNVSGQNSNGVLFTLIVPGTIAGTITQAANGNPLAGATVQAVFQGIVKATATTPANGSYSLAGLDPATYDLRVYATGYSSEVRSTTTTSNATAMVNVSMLHPGSIAGRVTQADGLTPISGAAVTVYAGPSQKGSASTNGAGDYSIANLHPGPYTVQTVDVGYRTKEQGAVVDDGAMTTANVSLDVAPSGPVLYAYDALGRLIQVTDPSGDTAIYRYDPVGNITGIERPGANVVSITGFTPTTGSIGASVTIYGAGFSSTPGQNTVTFGCGTSCTVSATVTSATPTQLVVTVPATALDSPIAISVAGVTATSAPRTFAVSAAGAAPTIAGFTPTLVVAGTSITVTGTNFDATPTNDWLTTNVASAQVTSAGPTSLQATVPITTTGRVSIATQNGTATSSDYLWVAPAPYAVSSIDSTGLIAFGAPTTIAIAAGKVAMRAFDSAQGHRASASVTNAGTFAAGGAIAIYGPYANPTGIGFGSTGFLEPVDLRSTATYTLILAPNGAYTGSANVTLYDVPPDQAGPILPSPASVPVSLQVPGQNARLTFSGTATTRVSVTATPTPNFSGVMQVLRPDGTTLSAVNFFPEAIGFLDAVTLPTSGPYTVLFNPRTTDTGNSTVTLYNVTDTTGSLAINGSAVPVPLDAPGQNGSLTFTGIQGQQVTVHVTGNGIGSVRVKLVSIDGQTVLSNSATSGDFDLLPATLPTTTTGSAVYTIIIDPISVATGTLNISITSS